MPKHLVLILAFVCVTPGKAEDGLTASLGVNLDVRTAPGFSYRILQSDSLGTWRTIGQALVGDGTTFREHVDTALPAGFFRTERVAIQDLNPMLAGIRSTRGMPGLAAVVVLEGRIAGLGAVGVRKYGEDVPVSIDDKWHIGSITKSMTATLAGMLVDEGRIRWTDTLGSIFSDVEAEMAEEWRAVTLEQLTSNRSSIPGSATPALWTEFWNYSGSPRSARRLVLRRMTEATPAAPPGSRYEYSNFGFAIAGHMLETVMNKPWEELITERLFKPLGMTDTGFGAPAAARHVDHPLGHYILDTSAVPGASNPPSPTEQGIAADNPPAIGPGATVHTTLKDFAKYMMFQIEAYNEGHLLLSKATARKLQTAVPNNGEYAHGWIVTGRPWAGAGPAVTHTGSNNQWFAMTWMAPARKFGVVAFANVAGDHASIGTDEVAWNAIERFVLNEQGADQRPRLK